MPLDNPFEASSSPFNLSAGGWTPQAQQKEEFPDLMTLPAKSKKKNQVKSKEEIEAEK